MALKATKDAVRAICATDPSITAEQVKAALAELDGAGVREMAGTPPPRSYTGKQVAQLIHASRKTVTKLAKDGLLVPIMTGAKGERARRYTGASVAALLEGARKEGA